MCADQESADESRAVTQMIAELEALLAGRRRVRKLVSGGKRRMSACNAKKSAYAARIRR